MANIRIEPIDAHVHIDSPDVSVTVQELHDAIEDFMASPEGLLYEDIIDPQGKIADPGNPGVFSQIIMVLNSPWQILFWPGSGYTRISGGKIAGGLGGQPMKATGTAGDITVLESQVDGVVVVSGSGVTAQDKTDIAAATLAAAAAAPIDANVKKVNDVSVTGTGVLGDEWGPVP